MNHTDPLRDFHPIVRSWFTKAFHSPSPPQQLGWPSISAGQHTLILAPTGSGKTLAAFLWAINHLVEQHLNEDLAPGVRILYVSPLKALNNDIHRNLESPLKGITEEAHTARMRLPSIRSAVRTGDTPQSARQKMLKHPPDILITTPESLYLMLTSKLARQLFTTVQYVIIDEIHALCGNKRGVHLSLSLERLAAVADQEFIRIGLSATQRPLEEIARFLGGQRWEGRRLVARPVTIVDAGQKKSTDLLVTCAVPDFSLLPPEGVWPAVFEEILSLIRQHATTLIFVNNRRLAERVAATLNSMALGTADTYNLHAVPRSTPWSMSLSGREAQHGREQSYTPAPTAPDLGQHETGVVVQAYHGSMSRPAREQMESDLKGGRLRALVATSSLELGIDIGSIDLVIQLQSPKGIARGLQRVGRSGHLMTATSKGRIFPTHREDLVEAAVVARGMLDHAVESTAIPHNCLDVLAQQIVAMVSVEPWDVDELYDVVRQSYCYHTLSEKLYRNVLQMLAGRYTHEAFRELRARISWDKVNNALRALPGSAHLAITSGGTITDRGAYGVYLEDRATKLGEVDEEFIFESRVGDTFILGTNVWQMRSIEANRILVTPAPGQPARMPFWRGEGVGRSFEMGALVGAFRRELGERLESPDCLQWLLKYSPIDSSAAWNLQDYLRRQRDATGVIPSDTVLLVEGFRDEIGDPRVVVHSSFGRRVNGLLGLVAARRVQELTATEPQMLYNDDGILLRCSDADTLPLSLFENLNPEEIKQLAVNDILMAPVFGGQFRQNAARALLMPKSYPGKRTPLWLQRLRAADLLQIARQFDDFPIVIETLREVLNDVLDFDHFTDIMTQIANGSIRVVSASTEVPSPFATSLLFDFIAVYMYEWDQPRADKMSQYLAINREVLSEIIDIDSIKDLLRPEAITSVEAQLQHTATGTRARSPEELLEILLRVGALSSEEVRERTEEGGAQFLDELESSGRAVEVTFRGSSKWVAGEESGMYRDPDRHANALHIVRRYVQHHGPITRAELVRRYDLPPETVDQVLQDLSSTGQLVKGRFRQAEPGLEEWIYRPNLERIHRQTISILRKEITPSSLEEYTHFLHQWTALLPDHQRPGLEALDACCDQFQAIPLPAETWEREIFYRRVKGYSRDMMLQLAAAGAIVWVGAGSGKMKFIRRGGGSAYLSPPAIDLEESLQEPARRILRHLHSHGASFLHDIRSSSRLSLHALNNGIAELFWKGLISNDVFDELVRVKRPSRVDEQLPLERIELLDPQHNRAKSKLIQSVRRAVKQAPGWTGRWCLVHVADVLGENLTTEEMAVLQARQLLERYGILARELCRREDLLPWGLIATQLQRMEMRGEIRRGYFVKGLSGMQYALPTAVEHIRRIRKEPAGRASPLLLNTCDPANPFGTGIDIPGPSEPTSPTRVVRQPGNYLVFVRGLPVLYIENSGARLWTLAKTTEDVIREGLASFTSMIKLPMPLRPFSQITVEHVDGLRPPVSTLGPLLLSLGFRRDANQTMTFDGYL